MSEPQAKATKRPRHLMDPANPRREIVRSTGSGGLSLEPVQKWVLSVLAATTIAHMAIGLVIAAMYVDSSRTDAQIGLNVLAAAFGILTVAVYRAIHQMSMVSAWLLPGLLPGIVGLYLTLG